MTRRTVKLVREGKYAAEVPVDLIEDSTGWSPYLSIEDAMKRSNNDLVRGLMGDLNKQQGNQNDGDANSATGTTNKSGQWAADIVTYKLAVPTVSSIVPGIAPRPVRARNAA